MRRELAFRRGSIGPNDGDRWHLVFDADRPGLWVEHSWEHSAPVSGHPQKGSDRYGVNDFLAFRDNEAAHRALVDALASLFESPTPGGETKG